MPDLERAGLEQTMTKTTVSNLVTPTANVSDAEALRRLDALRRRERRCGSPSGIGAGRPLEFESFRRDWVRYVVRES
jgi:hypothetical protein